MTCTATHTFTQAELDANGSPTAGSGFLSEHGDRVLERGADSDRHLEHPDRAVAGADAREVGVAGDVRPRWPGDLVQLPGHEHRQRDADRARSRSPTTRSTDESCPATATLAPRRLDHLHRDVHGHPGRPRRWARSPTPPRDERDDHLAAGQQDRDRRPGTGADHRQDVDRHDLRQGRRRARLQLPRHEQRQRDPYWSFTVADDKATDEACPATATLAPVRRSRARRPTPSPRPTSTPAP